jgi:taurine dioxygenase
MATTMAKEAVSFERVTGNIGALVRGVELDGEMPVATLESLRDAVHEFGVLFFEFDDVLDDASFRKLASWFGEPEDGYALRPRDVESPVIDSALTPMEDYRINVWHTDGSTLECPPQTAILTALEVPVYGGDTMWASMYAAWDDLSSHHQRLLDGLEARHGTKKLPFLDQSQHATHPVVLRDPVTERRMLYVNSNYTEYIVGMKESESDSLLRMLYGHVNTPEFHVRLRWRPGKAAVWDERATQHRGVADFTGTRRLRRLTFPGARPAA